MENWNNQNDEQQNLHSDNEWQTSENDKDQNTDDSFNMNSAEADGYGIDPNTADDALFAVGDDDDDDDDDLDADDSEEEETSKRDWGSVDPLSDTDGLPSGVDPSGPGSAV